MQRIGYVGNKITLNAQFLKNGVPTVPFAIRAIRIYRQSVRSENLVYEMIFPDPDTPEYQIAIDTYLKPVQNPNYPTEGNCGTEIEPQYIPGAYDYELCLSKPTFTCGAYFDVWCFIGDEIEIRDADGNCTISPTEATASVDWDNEDYWTCICNQFWVKDNAWVIDSNLTNIRLGFEPLDIRFSQPEKRYLEVGIMPLPLYDFDYKLLSNVMPSLKATITIESQYCEVMISDASMQIGLRAGSYRSNPYVLKYLVDTTKFMKGTYKYRVNVEMPNGTSIVSKDFHLVIR